MRASADQAAGPAARHLTGRSYAGTETTLTVIRHRFDPAPVVRMARTRLTRPFFPARMRDQQFRKQQMDGLRAPHVASVNALVDELTDPSGRGWAP